jgi:hypothetical protein
MQLRADAGELNIRLAGVEVERDHLRAALAASEARWEKLRAHVAQAREDCHKSDAAYPHHALQNNAREDELDTIQIVMRALDAGAGKGSR